MACPDTPIQLTGCLFGHGRSATVEIENGIIRSITDSPEPHAADGREIWLIPGFFDLQLNGFAGRDFINPAVTVEDIEHIARAVLATGTTRFLPTVITADLDAMCAQLRVIAEAMRRVPLVGRMCPGVHIEGPFIHPEDGPRGAHPREHVRPPNVADYERLREAAEGKVALFTLAPDQPGAADVIRHIAAQGTLVALGHHRADAAAIAAAVEAGARMCTHLGNGSDATLPRLDNPIWRQLGEDRLHAGFIADGHHLPAPTLRCMLRAKTPARSVLVTDAMAAAGMPPGRYRLGASEVELTPAGKVVLPGTPYLAGSGANMPQVVGNAVALGGVTFEEAVQMAAINPRMLMAGQVEPWACTTEAAADLVQVEWDPSAGSLRVLTTVTGPFTA